MFIKVTALQLLNISKKNKIFLLQAEDVVSRVEKNGIYFKRTCKFFQTRFKYKLRTLFDGINVIKGKCNFLFRR